ncbi:MAG: phytoene desaturase [Maricaulaceae bacterium]
MLKQTDPHKDLTDPRPHAVVIGSGFGGLAAAVRLGARGYRVSVFEKLDAPGGRAYVHRQDGFTFDAGPTIITVPFLLEELWTLCGKKMSDDLEMREIHPFYVMRFDDGEEVRCWRDVDKMREEVARVAPDDVAGYNRFLKKSEQIYRVCFEQLGAQAFHSLGKSIITVPRIFTVGGHLSVYQMVSKFFKSKKLRTVFSFHPLLIGGDPFNTTAAFCLINHLERNWGVHAAMGGTGAIVQGLVGLIEGQGGAVRCNAEVDEILVRDGEAAGVTLKTGETVDADIVVSNAESGFTYSHLLRNHNVRRWHERRLKNYNYSMSLFVWYFGTNKQYDDVEHHSIVLGPRYKELLHDIFRKKVLADDFSLYLHRPTATDPSLAPPGHDAFYVLSPVPHLQADVDWTVQAEPYRQAIEQRLSETLLPGLKDAVVSSKIMTPLDFRDRLNSLNGAAFGFEPSLFQSAWFRPHNKSEELKGLYIVGAGCHPGAGVPGVVMSAKILDEVVPDASVYV